MVYHISEDPNIKEFIPRKSEIYKELPPVVWAIDKEHLINYYFPRDCPRIIYTFSPNVTEEDKIKFFSNTISEKIITVENRWYEAINKTILYKYIFCEEKFRLIDNIAGYYVSEEKNKAKSVEKIEDALKLLIEQNIELRFTQNIFPLKEALIKSSINNYSIIRFRNAKE
jgi:hypothetical protein